MIALSPVWSWILLCAAAVCTGLVAIALSRMASRDEAHMSQRWLEKQVLAEWRQDSEAGGSEPMTSADARQAERTSSVSSRPLAPVSELYDQDDVAIGAVLALYDQDQERGQDA